MCIYTYIHRERERERELDGYGPAALHRYRNGKPSNRDRTACRKDAEARFPSPPTGTLPSRERNNLHLNRPAAGGAC